MSERSYEAVRAALVRPIEFAARKGGENLAQIKNFSETVLRLLEEAAGLAPDPKERGFIENLRRDFNDFDKKSFDDRRLIVRQALSRFVQASNSQTGPSQKVPEKVMRKAVKVPLNAQEADLLLQRVRAPITTVKGVGKAMEKKLAKKNISTIEDVLFDLPVRYEDRSALAPIGHLQPGMHATVRGRVLSAQVNLTRKGQRVLTVLLGDESGAILCKWFSYRPHAPDKRFTSGREMICSGLVELYQGHMELHHPEMEFMEDATEYAQQDPRFQERIIPIYSLTEGLTQRFYRGMVQRVAHEFAKALPDFLPAEFRERYGLPPLDEAIVRIHCPDEEDDIENLNVFRSASQRRMIFEELFILSMRIEMRRLKTTTLKGIAFSSEIVPLTTQLRSKLPFTLTQAQERVLKEIYEDMSQSIPMNRLLQGDVGSGKTIVALMSSIRAIENQCQTALMAPTEILAEQHAINLRQLLTGIPVRIELLTGSTPRLERQEILEGLANGKVHLIVGTHALIEDDVQFYKLGLVIVDEQHRFGVLQRVNLHRKGVEPHALVMTATPIPRTLAMTVYGELDLSILDELPPGRSPIKTVLYRQSDHSALYKEIELQTRKGHQVYIVYPLIEESETLDLKNALEMYERYSKVIFPHLRLGLLHGRMKSAEKEEVMKRFQSGEIQVLISTTVIEVGIDVPNATLMVIENAERFGLSQLHQLRGRVGRSRLPSKCILVSQRRFTADAKERLQVMLDTTDGFRIAEEDLRIRGPGEVLGTRQAGLPTFCYADLRRDSDILIEAREAARDLLQDDSHLQKPQHAAIRRVLSEKWRGRLYLSRIG